ncbi:MAG: cyclic-di-AMP receptor [Armatimonadetes bacterium]|nr:cyclic-di-AMP receptor [Armatimonadota bacterium]
MKLIVAVIHDRDQKQTSDALLRAGFKFTKIASTGGFLREGNATLLIGAEADEVDVILGLINESCRTREQYVNVLPPEATPVGTFLTNPVKVQVGGAIAFVVDVERFERM